MSRKSVLITAAAVLGFVATIAAQDPLAVSPEAYRLEFENAWVKVVRVHYAPKAVIAPHFHTERPSAYVYLNDGGPILFKHEGLPYAAVTRPATRAGSFRVYKGIHEVHSVENPTQTPSEFLRVEFKTEPLDDASLRGKFFREPSVPPAALQRMQFENAQMRITRVLVPSGDALDVTATAGQPTLLVALTPGAFGTGAATGRDNGRRLQIGQTGWLEAGVGGWVRPIGPTPFEVLRFEFKTRPVDAG